MENHNDYPSLLSIKDVLYNYGINSVALRKDLNSYEDFETPFICSIQKEDWATPCFIVVSEISNNIVNYLDPLKNIPVSVSLNDFENIDKGIVLLFDDSLKRDEDNYLINKKHGRIASILSFAPVYILLTVILTVGTYIIRSGSVDKWISLGFLISSCFGLIIAFLLIWHEVDKHNPLLKEVCGGNGKKVNCDAVLNSSSASFLGISWGVWGFSFMATLFLTQIIYANNLSQTLINSILSLIVTPYIVFSIYYQGKVIKQWCPLCLAVQLTLIINAILGYAFIKNTSFDFSTLSYYSIIITLFLGLVLLIVTYNAIPILRNSIVNKKVGKEWNKMRYNINVFNTLLNSNPQITEPFDELGIVVGNPDAAIEIIKVCNPYCGPCSKLHPDLESIIRYNSNVKVRIIFTASGNDSISKPVIHLLAIQQKYDVKTMQQALDDWYLAPEKDYIAFAEKYLLKDELLEQQTKVEAMRNWCDAVKIRVTPTIFINGRELPDSYNAHDLKRFF